MMSLCSMPRRGAGRRLGVLTLLVQIDDGLGKAADDVARVLLFEALPLLQQLLQLAALTQLRHQVHPL